MVVQLGVADGAHVIFLCFARDVERSRFIQNRQALSSRTVKTLLQFIDLTINITLPTK